MNKNKGIINVGIFVIDDDVDTLYLIEEKIKELGITNYHLFTDEKKYLEGLSERIDVLVLDHRLQGGMNGVDVLRIIRQKNEYTFVIIMSGTQDRQVLINYIKLKADEFVDKMNVSTYLDELMECVQKGLQIAQSRINFYQSIKKEIESREY